MDGESGAAVQCSVFNSSITLTNRARASFRPSLEINRLSLVSNARQRLLTAGFVNICCAVDTQTIFFFFSIFTSRLFLSLFLSPSLIFRKFQSLFSFWKQWAPLLFFLRTISAEAEREKKSQMSECRTDLKLMCDTFSVT